MNFDDIATVPQTTASSQNDREERVLASRRVLRAARSHADLRHLLNMIGLNEPARTEAK